MPLKEPTIENTRSEGPMTSYYGGLRRAEDWERLTRLEYIVESLAKESERQSKELSLVVQTQAAMISHLKTIKYTIMGVAVGLVISQVGLDKTLAVLAKLLGLG